MLLFVLLVLAAARNPFSGTELIPATVSDPRIDKSSYVVRLDIGEPRASVHMITDFNLSTLILSFVPVGAPEFILVRIGSHRMFMVYSVDPSAPALRGCEKCLGVFPMGSGSPLWWIFRTVTVTSSAIRLMNFVGRRAEIPCISPRPEFCVAKGKIFGEDTDVYFAPTESATIVPPWAYREYKRRAVKNGFWPDLALDFGEHKLVIPGNVIFDDPLGEDATFLLRQHEDGNNDTILGDSVFLAAQIHKNANLNSVAFRNWPVQRSYRLLDLVLVAGAFMANFRWYDSPPIYFVDNTLLRLNTLSVVMDTFLEGFAILLPGAVFAFGGEFFYLFRPVYFGVVLCAVIGWFLLMGVWVQVAFWTNAVTYIGFMTSASTSAYTAVARRGFVRLRVAREVVTETSLLLTVFIIAFRMSGDTMGSYLALATYLWFLTSLLRHIVSGFIVTRFGASLAWMFFIVTTICVNLALWLVLVLEVFLPMLNMFVPRRSREILLYAIVFHVMFVAITFRLYAVRTRVMIRFIDRAVPELAR